jgi:hypothetical protein
MIGNKGFVQRLTRLEVKFPDPLFAYECFQELAKNRFVLE